MQVLAPAAATHELAPYAPLHLLTSWPLPPVQVFTSFVPRQLLPPTGPGHVLVGPMTLLHLFVPAQVVHSLSLTSHAFGLLRLQSCPTGGGSSSPRAPSVSWPTRMQPATVVTVRHASKPKNSRRPSAKSATSCRSRLKSP